MRTIYLLNNKISIFSLIVFLPFFLSLSSNGSMTFDRQAGVSSEYIYTIPISFLFVFLILLKKSIFLWFGEKICSINLFIFFLYSFLCILINYLIYLQVNSAMLKVVLLMMIFLFLLEWFDYYFIKVFTSKESHALLEKKYILYPLVMILILTIFSTSAIKIASFLSEFIIIYNYEQYFAFLFIILSGIVMNSNFNQFSKFLIYFLSFFIAYLSSNLTAILLLLVLFSWHFIILNRLKFALHNLILILLVFMVPLYYLFIYAFYEAGKLSYNFETRVEIIRLYFDNLSWLELLFPFIQSPRGLFQDLHSQHLEVFNTFGFIGLFYFFGVILSKLKKIGSKYPDISVSVALVIFIGGLIVNTSMHPYLIVCLAYIIAFYFRSSSILGK